MSIDPTLSNNNSFEDADIELGRPSYDEASYVRPLSTFKIIAVISGVIGFSAISAGLYYFAYQQGLAAGQKLNPPIIAADPGPIRVSPDEAGIKMDKAPDLNIYSVMKGEVGTDADATPPAENDGSRESLLNNIYTQNNDTAVGSAERTPAPASPPKTISIPKPVVTESEPKVVVASKPEVAAAVKPVTPPIQANSKPKAKYKAEQKQIAQPVEPRFMVQLSATRSRAIARQTYTNLQKKYSQELQNRDPLIFRADLGAKGIFYRVNVGGFSSKQKATQFCNELKAKGASCLVKNEPS